MADYKVLVNTTTGRIGPYPIVEVGTEPPVPSDYQYVTLEEGTPVYDVLLAIEGRPHFDIDIWKSTYNFESQEWDYAIKECEITWNDVITNRNALLDQSDYSYATAIIHGVDYAQKMWKDYRAHLRILFDNVDFEKDNPCEFEFPEGPFEIEAMSEYIQAGNANMKVIADSKVRRGDVWYTEMYQRLGISTTGVQ